jgi:hypothetical protein
MTCNKLENLMNLLDTLRVYHQARVHDLYSDNLTVDTQDNCIEKIKHAKQEILDLFQEK